MAATIKVELIECLKTLNGVPKNKKERLEYVLSQLERSDTVIAADSKGKQEVCDFLVRLFSEMPELMIPANKKHLEDFSRRINLSEVPDITARKQPPRTK